MSFPPIHFLMQTAPEPDDEYNFLCGRWTPAEGFTCDRGALTCPECAAEYDRQTTKDEP